MICAVGGFDVDSDQSIRARWVGRFQTRVYDMSGCHRRLKQGS